MTNNLTSFQQGLVDDLIKEFERINPKPKVGGGKRFSFDTINECIQEEDRFKQTITKHNLTMMKVFLNQFEEELKAFKEEYGKVFDVQIGHSMYQDMKGTIEKLIKGTQEKPLSNNEYNEIYLFVVSKKIPYESSDSRYDYCNGMKYQQIFIDFKRDRVTHKLESGKEIVVYKIVGLEYRRYQYSDKGKVPNTSTLDELIQIDKEIQKSFVALAS
jgi:hypothetical protein